MSLQNITKWVNQYVCLSPPLHCSMLFLLFLLLLRDFLLSFSSYFFLHHSSIYTIYFVLSPCNVTALNYFLPW
jgi:hypothetical protein